MIPHNLQLRDQVLWRRVDEPGHDACRLLQGDSSWNLSGKAVFRSAGEVAALEYEVVCDSMWRSMRGTITGWWGDKSVAIDIQRSAGGLWIMNGSAVIGLDDCIDLDLGFTPATNLVSIRRLALSEGQRGHVSAAWLALPSGSLERLDQLYERRTKTTYWYQAPRFDYDGLLEVSASGFICRYPGFWGQEPSEVIGNAYNIISLPPV